MFLLICVIRATALERAREALSDIGCLGITVSEVLGYGRQRGHREFYRGAEYTVQLQPKVQITVACTKGELNLAIDAVRQAALTGPQGALGDGKIFVLGLEDVVRIRTGESGKDAI
jgi:nitrogen regulatory protein P-II 2